ncbi:hypothetical protein KDL29_05655 [bacterium]|nr:hypothetical protein [bacterium]
MNAVKNNAMRNILAVIVLLALGLLASCGGGTSAMADLDGAAEQAASPVVDIEAPVEEIADMNSEVSNAADIVADSEAIPDAAEGDIERGTSGVWYVATAGADYVNGVDMLFQLWTDGMGNYKFVLKATNNSAQTKLLIYDKDRHYQFSISQNGQLKKVLRDNKIAWFPEFRGLAPYQTIEYTRLWDGRDSHGNKLYGIVDVEARHVSSSHPSTMKAIAWMNGQ